MDEDLECEICVPADWWEARKEWTDLRHNIVVRYRELEMTANNLQPMLEGCSDVWGEEGD